MTVVFVIQEWQICDHSPLLSFLTNQMHYPCFSDELNHNSHQFIYFHSVLIHFLISGLLDENNTFRMIFAALHCHILHCFTLMVCIRYEGCIPFGLLLYERL